MKLIMRKPRHAAQSQAVMAFLLLVSMSPRTLAQDEAKPFCRNAIYLEFLGQGILYSLNYDYRVTEHFSLRAGFSQWSIDPPFILSTKEVRLTLFPLMVNYLSGSGTSNFELGIGIVPASVSLQEQDVFFGIETEGEDNRILGTVTIGYRAQPRDGGFVFRVGLTPLFTFDRILPFGGVSLGLTF